jgi:molybdopterin biosynthesis enzyme
MSVFLKRPVLATLADARAWIGALGLGPAPALPTAGVLAADLVVATPLPAVPTARRTGWAVPAEATLGASPYGPVPLAGLRRVAAGEALPPGTDAVLPPDQASDAGPWGEVTGSAAPGEGVVEEAGHLRPGQVLARAGEVPPPLALLLAAAAEGRLPALLAAMTPPGLTLGPVAAPEIAGLAARPIEETALGQGADGAPAVALPADPAAMLLAWCALLGTPAGCVTARLARKLPSAVGLTDLVLVRLAEGVASPLAAADQPCLAGFSQAAGWVEVPAGSEGWPEGAEGSVSLLPPLLTG